MQRRGRHLRKQFQSQGRFFWGADVIQTVTLSATGAMFQSQGRFFWGADIDTRKEQRRVEKVSIAGAILLGG